MLSDDDTAVSEEGRSETSSAITIVTRQLYLDGLSRYDYDGSGVDRAMVVAVAPGSGGDHGTVDVTVGQRKVGVEVEGTLTATVISARGKVGVTVDNGKVNVSGAVRVHLGEGGGGGTGTSGSFGGFPQRWIR